MKKYKKLLLFILPFFLTGCTVDYNITFKSDNTLDENIKITESTKVLEESGYTVDEIIEGKIASYNDEISSNHFKIKKTKGNDTTVTLTSKNKSLEKMLKFSYFTRMFNGADITETNEKFKFKTNGDYNQSGLFYDLEGFVDEGFVDVININIKFEDTVISSNADSVDDENNIYTWTIDKNTEEKSIEFELKKPKKKKKSKEEFKIDKNVIIFVGALVSLIIVILLYVLYLNQKRNKI